MSIRKNLEQVLSELPEGVTLVAVSKTHPVSAIMEAYEAGQRHFGENRVQEMTAKSSNLPGDICWHQIGHLQRNKVKYIAPFVHLIHSVDSFKLLREIDKEARKNERVIDCLLQIHIADESSKFGLSYEAAEQLLTNPEVKQFAHVRLKGVMGMATFTSDVQKISSEFCGLKNWFDGAMDRFADNPRWQPSIICMGMSGDYRIAIECGSNMVRIGSAIFGQRG